MVSMQTFSASLWSFFIISALHVANIAVAQRGRAPHYELPPNDPHEYPVPVNNGQGGGGGLALVDVDSGGRQQPFVQQNYGDVATLEPLLEKLATAIDEVNSEVKSQINANSPVDYDQISLSKSDAEIGCSVYSYYQSRCSVNTAAIVPFTIGYIVATPAASDIFASCACYSSTWWVPNLYDNADRACLQVSSNNTNFQLWSTTYFGSVRGFCNFNNPRSAVFASGLAQQTTTTAVATATTSAAQPGTQASSIPSQTSTNDVTRLVTPRFGGRGNVKLVVIGVWILLKFLL